MVINSLRVFILVADGVIYFCKRLFSLISVLFL